MENKKKIEKSPYERQSERAVLVPFRNIENYKKMHESYAKEVGKLEAFMTAPTFTKARRILFG